MKPIKPFVKVPDVNPMTTIKAGIEKIQAEELEVKQEIFGLMNSDDAIPIASVQDAVNNIRGLMESENIPFKTIEIGLKHVMKLIKQYDDIVLELAPSDIETIVTSYMTLADEETRTIFDKVAKSKAKSKVSPSYSTKKVIAAAKESDFDEVDLSQVDI